MLDPATIRSYFEPGGVVAESLPGFEPRPGQAAMAAEVARALKEGFILMAEAGTGVGKSLAYLVPVLLHAREMDVKTVVSTQTIALQEQILHKDIPFLQEALPVKFRAVLVKGRGNYICLRRLEGHSQGELPLLVSTAEEVELGKVRAWARVTRDGSRADIGFAPTPMLWARIQSESSVCLGKLCPFRGRCFYFAARRNLNVADLLVVNHALLLSNAVIRDEGRGFLPDYDILVVDEAHALERAADENLGTEVTNIGVRMALDFLHNPKTGRGLLQADAYEPLRDAVSQVRGISADFFGNVEAWMHQNPDETLRIREPDFVSDPLSGALNKLSDMVSDFAGTAEDSSLAAELLGVQGRLAHLSSRVFEVIAAGSANKAYWVERRGRGGRIITLKSAPLRAGDLLDSLLFAPLRTGVLTSATLSTGGDDPFSYFTDRLGVPDPVSRTFSSPFDYQRQVTLHIVQSMPDPRHEAFPASVSGKVKEHLLRSHGKAFVLFTSFRLMNQVADDLAGFFSKQDYSVFVQGAGLDRTRILDCFRKEVDSVLFGTNSFWEGVDVRGESLSNVIITRLPFSVPNHPLIQARMERIREEGGNPFLAYSVPDAVIRFKQGFGRLIRTSADMGSVVLLDQRVVTKFYGRLFLNALPKCRVVYE
jgi:ATP-dependent DNA helicase DinG